MDKGSNSTYRLKFTDAGATLQNKMNDGDFVVPRKNGTLEVLQMSPRAIEKHELPPQYASMLADEFDIKSWDDLQAKKLPTEGEWFTVTESLPVEATTNTVTIDWSKMPQERKKFLPYNRSLPNTSGSRHYRIEDDGLRISNIANFQYAAEEWVRD